MAANHPLRPLVPSSYPLIRKVLRRPSLFISLFSNNSIPRSVCLPSNLSLFLSHVLSVSPLISLSLSLSLSRWGGENCLVFSYFPAVGFLLFCLINNGTLSSLWQSEKKQYCLGWFVFRGIGVRCINDLLLGLNNTWAIFHYI